MASGGFDIAKAGWLFRQSTVLHRWKKNWFVLDREGDLRYFENPDTPRAEERLVVRAVVGHVRTGPDVRTVKDTPEGVSSSKACFIELAMKDNSIMLLCAESFDDMRAWQIALEEARSLHVPPRPSPNAATTFVAPPGGYIHQQAGGYVHPNNQYNMGIGYSSYYPGQVISTAGAPAAPVPQVVYGPNGSTTTIINGPPSQQIVYVDDCPYRGRRHYGRRGYYPAPMFFW